MSLLVDVVGVLIDGSFFVGLTGAVLWWWLVRSFSRPMAVAVGTIVATVLIAPAAIVLNQWSVGMIVYVVSATLGGFLMFFGSAEAMLQSELRLA
jgi:hypothetical protein